MSSDFYFSRKLSEKFVYNFFIINLSYFWLSFSGEKVVFKRLFLFGHSYFSMELSIQFKRTYQLFLRHIYNLYYLLDHNPSSLMNAYSNCYQCKTHQFCLKHKYFSVEEKNVLLRKYFWASLKFI